MYISRISLHNVRGFHDLAVACHPEQRQTLILGKNGAGKTTLLRAIALGLCPERDAHALLAEPIGGLIAEHETKARIELELAEAGRTVSVLYGRGANVSLEQRSELATEPFVCGYGAGRAGIGAESTPRYSVRDAVYTLFNYRQPLLNPELTLRRLRDYIGTEGYEATLRRIKQGLELSPQDEILLPKGGGVVLSGPSVGREIPLEAWADGYRLTFNWLIDLYGWAMQAAGIGDDGHVRGIVLVDEIEQHLHPSLQTEILPRLAAILPHVQLFATTHSPLAALGAAPESVVVLQEQAGRIVRAEPAPDFSGYSAEDMLVDERLFDTPNVYTPDTNRKLAEYNRLAEIPAEKRAPEEKARLRGLAQDLRSQELPPTRQQAADSELRQLLKKHGL